jgi:hypothetical protein
MMFSLKKTPFSQIEQDMAYTNHVSRLEQREIERCFARLFSSEDGKKALAWLQVITFQKAQGPSAPEDHLRYTEGQRGLVAQILRLIDRGKTQ